MIKNSSNKTKKLINIIKLPLIFLALMWAVKLSEIIWDISFVEYGVLPREASGIQGILFSPFIHKDIKHLINNSIPILILGSSLCYFFKKNFKKVFPNLFNPNPSKIKRKAIEKSNLSPRNVLERKE